MDLTYIAKGARRERDLQLDFSRLTVARPLQTSLKLAFEGAFGHLRCTTLKQNYYGVKTLCTYLCDTVGEDTSALERQVLQGFSDWLAASGRKGGTNQSTLNVVRSLLVFAARQNLPGIPSDIDANVWGFRRTEPVATVAIDEALKKRILEACQQEIIETESRFAAGIQAMQLVNEGTESELGRMLIDILTVGQGKYANKSQLRKRMPGLVQRMSSFGYKLVYAHLFLMQKDLFPFYLAIVADTGGNPDALHKASRECFIPHPTKSDHVLFVWQKARAHSEQFVGYHAKREWTAAGIARKLLVLTENLVPLAPPEERDTLFLGMSPGGNVGRCCTQLLHTNLGQFRTKYGLEAFTFKQFRHLAALTAYESRGFAIDAQERLNHRSLGVTHHYLNSPEIHARHQKTIVHFAGLLESSARTSAQEASPERLAPQPAETVFGFNCKDPFAGIAPGSQRGQACNQFFGCSTCPGAVVVLDDPKVIARLLKTADHLRSERRRATSEGWLLRFDQLWGMTLSVLEMDVLPLVTPEMRKLGEQQVAPKLPRLE